MTYALLEISKAAYDEIRAKLIAAGYEGQIRTTDDGELISMCGLAITEQENEGNNSIPTERQPTT